MNNELWQILNEAINLEKDQDGTGALLDGMSDSDLAEVAEALETVWREQSSCA